MKLIYLKLLLVLLCVPLMAVDCVQQQNIYVSPKNSDAEKGQIEVVESEFDQVKSSMDEWAKKSAYSTRGCKAYDDKGTPLCVHYVENAASVNPVDITLKYNPELSLDQITFVCFGGGSECRDACASVNRYLSSKLGDGSVLEDDVSRQKFVKARC